ncbi:hypothetical protein MOD72_12145 [Bacillus haynesii]|uniref:hypothetical protein n=1 Tax=Bacillus haynesii TaxID=1925021 RepID=UPI00227E12AD|nr:hypothetical protein [Bacillus haynesii]MCY8609928.1 hypothetical protein [Bacillus haynesii]MEC0752163.1 hypothetical protein [Bacillus haynesii]
MTEQMNNENTQNTNELVETKNQVATVNTGSNYITAILDDIQTGFIEANQGLDMDFVHMGDWLTKDSKGNFVEKDDEEVSYGDTIDIVVGQGEKRYSLWGLEGSPEDGELIVAEKELADAQEKLVGWLAENPDAAERYSIDDIKLRYMAFVVPVDTLKPDDFPKVYLMSFSPTDTIRWGQFAFSVYKGKYKKLNIPRGTGVNKIVTRLVTKEYKGASGGQKYIGLEFHPVGLFKPEDYGINPEEQHS